MDSVSWNYDLPALCHDRLCSPMYGSLQHSVGLAMEGARRRAQALAHTVPVSTLETGIQHSCQSAPLQLPRSSNTLISCYTVPAEVFPCTAQLMLK